MNIRRTIGGDEEEVREALLREAQNAVRLGRSWVEIYRAYIAAWNARPAMAEALVELAALARLRGEYDLAYALARRAASLPASVSALIDGDRPVARQSLLAMIHGAVTDPARNDAIARRAASLIAIADAIVDPAIEATFERLDPWTATAARIDCIVDEAFSPWMLSPLPVRYVARARYEPTRYARSAGPVDAAVSSCP